MSPGVRRQLAAELVADIVVLDRKPRQRQALSEAVAAAGPASRPQDYRIAEGRPRAPAVSGDSELSCVTRAALGGQPRRTCARDAQRAGVEPHAMLLGLPDLGPAGMSEIAELSRS